MKRSARLKDISRELWQSRSRLLAILMIVALGAGFFAGIRATGADMKITADQYYKQQELMDLRIVSTYGLEQEDIDAIKTVDGVDKVAPGYCIDALMNNDDQDVVVRVYSLDLNLINGNNDDSALDHVKLLGGRFPQSANECVVENGFLNRSGAKIGDTIHLTLDADTEKLLTRTEYKVVGVIESPLYISFERGYSSIGNGSVNSYVMIPQEDFSSERYTVVYLSAKGTSNISAYDKQYSDIVQTMTNRLENFSEKQADIQFQRVTETANEELSRAKDKLAEGQQEQKDELSNAQKKLDDAKAEIEKSQKELDDGKAELNKSIQKANKAFREAQAQLDEGEKQYQEGLKSYEKQEQSFEAALPQMQAQLDGLKQQMDVLNAQIAALEQSDPTSPLLVQMKAQFATMQAMYDSGKLQITQGEERLSEAQKQLEQSKQQLTEGKAMLESQKANFRKQRGKAEKQLQEGEQKLADAKAEYNQGLLDFDEAKKESDEELQNAQKEIDDAQNEIAQLEKPKWFVFTREDNPGYIGYGENADRMDAISEVFPVFFLLVAALVCLTTMTRMVEEQRMQIGILKALGYGKFEIALKYLTYAVVASTIGSFLGLIVGFQLFPTVVARAYNIMYHMPPLITPFRWNLALISLIVATACTTLVAFVASYRSLTAQPAELMRPRAPKPGKRILLEKIPGIWSRMKFLDKVTARNLFRYKRRMLMIIIGIAGCTALMVGGFSLKKSVSDVTVKQFGELDDYNLTMSLDADRISAEPDLFPKKLASYEHVDKSLLAWQANADISSGGSKHEAWILVPQSTEELGDMIHFRTRIGHHPVSLSDEGVVITEKLAEMLKVSAGGQINIQLTDSDKIVPVIVTGIVENYISHYVFFTPALAKTLFGADFRYNSAMVKLDQDNADVERTLTTQLLKEDEVLAVSSVADMQNTFHDVLHGMNAIVLVMILSAGLLAIIVLYNLTNINVTERYREIATIKVLGFYDKEVSAYVYRENIVLTIMGIIVGAFLGKGLHEVILNTAKVDVLMLCRETNIVSYLAAIGLTIAFGLLVNFFVHFRLKRIDMVESLKSIE